jgi:hypothetical protein
MGIYLKNQKVIDEEHKNLYKKKTFIYLQIFYFTRLQLYKL